jgi:hypothetical protein
MPARLLPLHPNLDQYKKQAKDIAGDVPALERLLRDYEPLLKEGLSNGSWFDGHPTLSGY